MHDTLVKSIESNDHIEEHLIKSKIESFNFPCTNMEPKMKRSISVVQDPITLINKKLDQMNNQFFQTQNQIMNRLKTLERYNQS
jgi:hypothetical protein